MATRHPGALQPRGVDDRVPGGFLQQAGFTHARRVPSFGLFNDMSSAKRFGRSSR